MPTYDTTRFDPPAPVAQVILRNPDNMTIQSNVPMLLDSGADVTLIPQTAVASLNVAIVSERRYELAGFDGNVSLAPVVWLDLLFCGRTFRGQFLLIDEPWGILGRNVLNAIPLLFDGPHLVWNEHSPD